LLFPSPTLQREWSRKDELNLHLTVAETVERLPVSGVRGLVRLKAHSWAEGRFLLMLVMKLRCIVSHLSGLYNTKSICVNGGIDKYNDATRKFDQTVSINGAIVSTLSTSEFPFYYTYHCNILLIIILGSGQAQGWGTAVECQADACKGTAAAHGKSTSRKKAIGQMLRPSRISRYHNYPECG
jgi:hypothetical protein